MRVVWAAAYGGIQRGGFVPALERVARRLIARGDVLDVVAPDVGPAAWHGDVRALGAAVHVVPDRPWAAARRVAALRGDVVHAHFHDWLVAVTLATWPSRARLLWHLHSTFEPNAESLRVTPRRRMKFAVLGARVSRFVCVSRTIAEGARALGADRRKIVVVPNAIDSARFFRPDAATRAAARARLALEGPAIAFFGRDPRIKGADVLAAALPELRHATVVAVAAPDATVEELRRHGRVVAVPFTDDVREVLWAADAVAMPSRGEGMPFVALEALACGVPVVASDLPWAAELAADNPGVRLAPAGDPAALAGALRAALDGGPAGPAGDDGDALERWAQQIVNLYDGRE